MHSPSLLSLPCRLYFLALYSLAGSVSVVSGHREGVTALATRNNFESPLFLFLLTNQLIMELTLILTSPVYMFLSYLYCYFAVAHLVYWHSFLIRLPANHLAFH